MTLTDLLYNKDIKIGLIRGIAKIFYRAIAHTYNIAYIDGKNNSPKYTRDDLKHLTKLFVGTIDKIKS